MAAAINTGDERNDDRVDELGEPRGDAFPPFNFIRSNEAGEGESMGVKFVDGVWSLSGDTSGPLAEEG